MTDSQSTYSSRRRGVGERMAADLPEPKFQIGDRVKVLYPWAGGCVATITDGAMWDEPLECYTYVVDNGLIRLEEQELELVERAGRAWEQLFVEI